MKRVEIFFGEMGAGKSYIAKRRASSTGLDFFEGDELASPEMVERVLAFKPLTREMIEDLVRRLTKEIKERSAKSSLGLAVAQALYFEEDRLNVESELQTAGFNVVWYWVKPSFFTNLQQLWSRPKGFQWVLYWLTNKPYFEKPEHMHIRL